MGIKSKNWIGRARPRKDGEPPNREKPKISPQEVAVCKALAEGKTFREAAEIAGLDTRYARQAAWDTFKRLKRKVPELMEEAGLSMQSLLQDLNKMRSATEVKVFRGPGEKKITLPDGTEKVVDELIYSEPLEAWGPRVNALDMSFKLHGAYARPENEVGSANLTKITVVIEDVSAEGGRSRPKIIDGERVQ